MDEPTCVCEQWSFSIELKSEAWDVSNRVKMQVSGEHLSNCKNVRKDAKKTVVKDACERDQEQSKTW